jgi:hypothetical protein
MPLKIEQLDGAGCLAEAQRMARFGHCDWLFWRDDAGPHAARKTAANLKRVLLVVGTKGSWTIIGANDGILMKGFWWLGINMLAQMKRGWA